jgi:hypothetical protein
MREKEETPRAFLPGVMSGLSPFVASTDGLLGKEAKTLLNKLSALLAKK